MLVDAYSFNLNWWFVVSLVACYNIDICFIV